MRHKTGLTIALALCLVVMPGCSGQDLEGVWNGPFPLLDSQDCRMSLKADHSFSLSCKTTSVLAIGRYASDQRTLSVKLNYLTIGKALVRPAPSFQFTLQGRGNELRLSTGRRIFLWRRRSL